MVVYAAGIAKEIRMITDKQVRILMKLINQEKTLLTAAARAGMWKKQPASTVNQINFPVSADQYMTGQPMKMSLRMIGPG